MTEKKTFNTKMDNGSLQYVNGYYFYGSHEFPVDDWDMEVTFTKKVKPVTEKMWAIDSDGDSVYVLAIAGQWAWVTGYPENLGDDSVFPDRVVDVALLTAQ